MLIPVTLIFPGFEGRVLRSGNVLVLAATNCVKEEEEEEEEEEENGREK